MTGDHGDKCELCEREVPATTEHHLIPKSQARKRGKRIHDLPTANLCAGCHKQLHALFDNRELALRLNDIGALRNEPAVHRFLTWVRRQPGGRYIRVRR